MSEIKNENQPTWADIEVRTDRWWKDSNDQYSGISLGKSCAGSLRWKLSINRYIIRD